jgi:hypothetical protein
MGDGSAGESSDAGRPIASFIVKFFVFLVILLSSLGMRGVSSAGGLDAMMVGGKSQRSREGARGARGPRPGRSHVHTYFFPFNHFLGLELCDCIACAGLLSP